MVADGECRPRPRSNAQAIEPAWFATNSNQSEHFHHNDADDGHAEEPKDDRFQHSRLDQNAFIERYNRTYRTEVLNAYVFESLEQVREISAEWLQSYNEERPHDALAGLPPAMYRANLEARNSPLPLSP